MRSFAALLICCFVLATCGPTWAQELNTDNDLDDDPDEVPPFQRRFSFGPLKLDLTHNCTKSRDKLKWGKSYHKIVLTNQWAPYSPLAFMKISLREELIRCQTIKLKRPEMNSMIDCQALDTQVLETETEKRTSAKVNEQYVKRATIKFKGQFVYREFGKSVRAFTLYPLQADHVSAKIDYILSANNVTSASAYSPSARKLGYYFETLIETTSSLITCNGGVYALVDQDKPESLAMDLQSIFMMDFPNYILQAEKNGGLLSMDGSSCFLDDPISFLPLSVDMDFTMIYKLEFPYLTLNHNIITHPFAALWSYQAFVEQTRHPTEPNSYITNIAIDSTYGLMTPFAYRLRETVEVKDGFSGTERTIYTVNNGFAAIINANWTIDSYMKESLLYLESRKGLFEPDESEKPWMVFGYENNPDDEYVNVRLRFRKKTLPNISHSLPSGAAKKSKEYRHIEL